MVMLTVGFTFTYMMEGFPNFAHTTYTGVGAITSFYLTTFFKLNPYLTIPPSALVGGSLGVLLYRLVVHPIKRNGGYQEITLTLTFIVLATVLPSFFYIFNFWARYFANAPTRGYNLRRFDFTYNGLKGITIVSTLACLILIIALRVFLTKTKTGISLRAVAENPDLAATIGVNTLRAHTLSWFISGALASLVGSIMTIHKGVGIAGPDGLIISIMAGAVLGGVNNLYGAIVGGLFVAVAEDLLKDFFYVFLRLGVERWARLLPVGFLVAALMVFPNGVFGPTGLNLEEVREAARRLLRGPPGGTKASPHQN